MSAGRSDVWLRAYCAVAQSFNAKEPDCIRYADACLKAFDERFPQRRIEAQFCGIPLSELQGEDLELARKCGVVPLRAASEE